MTYEEAIKILDEFGGCCSLDLEYIAAHKAIEALEKQIPQKPKKIYYSYSTIQKCTVCSVCKNRISTEDKYCKHCGQALDWSDEK